MTTAPTLELPVVSMAAPSTELARTLDRACEGTGFARLVGHGLDDQDGAAIFEAARQIFDRPRAEKRRLDLHGDPNFRGYESAGGREAFEIGEEVPNDGRPLCGPNRWPQGLDAEARARIEAHYIHCTAISKRLTQVLWEHNYLPKSWGHRVVEDSIGHLRLWEYPAGSCELPAHADHGFFTILLTSAPGLEVRVAEDSFAPAPPAMGSSLVMNVGRLLSYATGGRYQATVHRVRSEHPATRHSVPYFFAPNRHLRIAPPPSSGAVPQSVEDYVAWGYTWQSQVNKGQSVKAATGGAVDH